MECNECGSSMREEARACLSCGAPVRRHVLAPDRMQVAPAGLPTWYPYESNRTPKPSYLPASRIERILASLGDSLILTAVGWGLLLLTGAEVFTVESNGRMVFDMTPLLALLALNAGYTITFPATRWQATPGKKLFGLRIVTDRNAPIGFPRSGWRWVCQQAVFLVAIPLAMLTVFGILIIPIVILMFCGEGTSPWDRLAGTLVVS